MAQKARTPKGWTDWQAVQRRRTLAALLADLRRARANRDEWYVWIEQGCPRLTTAEYEALATRSGRARRARRGGAGA